MGRYWDREKEAKKTLKVTIEAKLLKNPKQTNIQVMYQWNKKKSRKAVSWGKKYWRVNLDTRRKHRFERTNEWLNYFCSYIKILWAWFFLPLRVFILVPNVTWSNLWCSYLEYMIGCISLPNYKLHLSVTPTGSHLQMQSYTWTVRSSMAEIDPIFGFRWGWFGCTQIQKAHSVCPCIGAGRRPKWDKSVIFYPANTLL